MQPTKPCILTINGGSSSIKFALFTTQTSLQRIFSGKVERIGLTKSTFTVKGVHASDNFTRKIVAPKYTTAIEVIVDWIEQRVGRDALVAVGHRIVHGGPKYSEPQLITKKMLKVLEQLTAFDAEHLPQEIQLAQTFHHSFPKLPQVACFDTLFHHDMPSVARLLPIPRRYSAKGIRRYGFHGLSYQFLMKELAHVAGRKAANERVVLAHLGNGASLAAVHRGKSMDTSMGLTPAAGVPMSTRCGDIDPGLAWYLAQTEGMSAKQFNEMVNFRSGLLGVSATSSDMSDLLDREAVDVRAGQAIALFCYQIKKCIGAYAAALGGIDTLVFSGGIGENSAVIRARICDNLEFLGIKLDRKHNTAHAGLISSNTSQVAVRVIPTDEEWMIANIVHETLALKN